MKYKKNDVCTMEDGRIALCVGEIFGSKTVVRMQYYNFKYKCLCIAYSDYYNDNYFTKIGTL